MGRNEELETKVLICCSVRLVGEGISMLLANDASIRLLGLACNINELNGLADESPDVIVADSVIGRDILLNYRISQAKILFLHTRSFQHNGFEELSEFLSKGFCGMLAADADIKTMRKAILAVAAGEIWLDRDAIKTLCQRLKEGRNKQLTRKETEIYNLLRAGSSNREIAGKLFISEATVKSHCHRLFKKLGINSRIKLLLRLSVPSED